MMNKQIIFSFVVGLLLLVGCQNEEENNIDDTGFFVSLANDVEVTTKSTPEELGEPYTTQFKLKVIDQATGVVKYSGNYKNGLFINTPAGSYTVTAECGSNPVLALDKPYYLGEAEGTVTEGQKTTVQIPCKVANALTSVMFNNSTSGQSFEEDFADYYVQVAVDTDNSHSYSTNVNVTKNGKSAYYQAGTMPKYTFYGIMKEGGAEYKCELTNDKFNDPANFAAGTNLVLALSMAKVEAGLKVVVEKVEVSKVDINETIPLEWLSKPKLETSSAFTNNAISVVETETVSNATIKLKTASALQDLKMKFSFADEQFSGLNEKEYLLSDATDKATVEEILGITLPEVGTTNGSLDFTSVVNRLQTNNGTTTVNTIELDAKANNRWSSEDEQTSRLYTLTCENPNISIAVDEANCWSREFTVNEFTLPEGSKADKAKIAANLVYQYYDGSDWKECTSRANVKGRLQQFSAAASDITTKSYKVRALYRGVISSITEATATLEEPTQLPNSDMEEWQESSVARSIITYSPWASGSSSFWQTNNSYTTRYVSKTGLLIGSYPYNCFPAVSYVVGGHTGTRAAEIRSTASGRGNTLPSNVLDLNKVAGELFTGNISVTTGGTAAVPSGDKYTIDTNGRSFSSRPSALSFWYKYAPLNSDTWKAKIVLMDADYNPLISKELTKSDQISDWTNAIITLDYNEKATYAKCRYIYIVFSSTITTGSAMQWTEYDSYQLWSNNSLKTFNDSKCWVGSVLKIDDISLIYDK